jgi:preprotein translocase subunit Sss1
MASTPKYMAVQAAALIVGAVLVLLGVLGFIPGITAEYDRLEWAAHQPEARLFGVIAVSGVHNIVNIVIGALGFLMARTYAAARAYFLGGALVYVAIWVYELTVVHVNDWLHFGLGLVMVLLGLTLAGQHDPTKRRGRIRARAAVDGPTK